MNVVPTSNASINRMIVLSSRTREITKSASPASDATVINARSDVVPASADRGRNFPDVQEARIMTT